MMLEFETQPHGYNLAAWAHLDGLKAPFLAAYCQPIVMVKLKSEASSYA